MLNLSLANTLRKIHIYQKRQLRYDLTASIVVFLIAIPLCLGIALASGAPLLSGLLSGIIGGCVIGVLSSSQVSVSGPSPGMVAVIIAAIAQLGDFNVFLLALFMAGIYQIIAGLFRSGFLADYIPSNVIQGFLSAIGLLIIIKQIPLAFTLSHSIASLKEKLLDLSAGFSLEPLREVTVNVNLGAALLSLGGLIVLFMIQNAKKSWIRSLPGPFVVVILGIVINEIFILTDSSLMQVDQNLVNIPKHHGFGDFLMQIQFPDWSAVTNPKVYTVGFLIAAVASLENLLNIKAGERIDTKKRYCSKDRELIAQGIGNILAGLAGALPITSVIVRTSVNIQAGAKTKGATILHGLFILMAVILIPDVMNKIPLSSLAAILIYTGYKLTKPGIYVEIYRQGTSRFLPFIVTVICMLCFNLLIGILAGLLMSLFNILKSSSRIRLNIINEHYPKGMINRLVLPQQTTFLNKASLVSVLESVPNKSQLIIDARNSEYIDKEIIEFINEFRTDEAPQKSIAINLTGFKDQYFIHDYTDFINVTTHDVQSMLSPQQALTLLKEGNARFTQDKCIHRSLNADLKSMVNSQHPIAVVLGCMDSRVPVETVFDMSFGDLFCIRVAGNIVNDDVLACLEYACNVIRVKLIVVLGHKGCGAIQAACDDVKQGHITQLLAKIKPVIAAEHQISDHRNGKNPDFVQRITELNIANVMHSIYHDSPILGEMIDKEDIGIVGAIYDIGNGQADFKDFSALIRQLDSSESSNLTEKLQKTIMATNKMNDSQS